MDVVSNSVPNSQVEEAGATTGGCHYAKAISLIITENLLYDIDVFDVEIHLGGTTIADSSVPPIRRSSANAADQWNGTPDCRVVYWGCGIRDIGSLSAANIKHVDFMTLRGPVSASDLRQGVRLPLGDATLLLPALYESQVKREFAGKTVCIPDFDDARSDLELQEASGCDLVLRPCVKMTIASVQDYIDALTSASFVLSAHYYSATTAIAYGKPFAFWSGARKPLPVEFEDLARFLAIPAQTVTNLGEGRELYREVTGPRLKLPPLWPLLVHSPYLLRAEGVLRVLRAGLNSLPVEERDSALLDCIEQLSANRPHFDRIENQIRAVIRRGLGYRLNDAPVAHVNGEAGIPALLNGSDTIALSAGAVDNGKGAARSNSVGAARAVDENPSPDAEELAHELSMARAIVAGVKAENLSLTSRLAAAKAQIAELEKVRVHGEENAVVLTNQVAALQQEKLAQIDDQARSRVDAARKEAAETALMLHARTEMRRARRRAIGLPFLLLSPTTRTHLRRAKDARLIHAFLQKLDHNVIGVAPEGREDRVLNYLMGMTDSVADFPLLQNTEYYEMYADVASAGMLPLVHWLRYGRKERRNVHPLLDTAYYTSNVPAANAFSGSPAEHYLKWGTLQQQNPHPLFETKAYLERYPDVAQRGVNPLCHFLQNPRCVPNWLFDPNHYLNENPDVALVARNALTHYLQHGWREGRNPHPFFITRYYLSNNPDVAASGTNPLLHFLAHGAREHRRTSPDFDPKLYLRTHPDVAQSGEIPLRHFLQHGIGEGRQPHNVTSIPRPATAIADSGRPVAVMIDAYYPSPNADSGSIDQIIFAKILKSLGFDVHYISLIEFGKSNAGDTAGRMKLLQEMGVVCVCSEQHAFIEEYLFVFSKRIAVVFASRVHFGGAQLGLVRTFCPEAKFIFNTVDLHYLREERQGNVTGSEDAINRAKATKQQEFECIRAADATIVISQTEKTILAAEGLASKIHHVPLIREFNDRPHPGFDERRDIAFVGGFKHQPNIDAVEYLLSEIWPIVHREHPHIVLEIIGADMPPQLASRKDRGVRFVGYVEDLDAHLGHLKATIAPLRYGAGAKGKLVMSLGVGVPVIASKVAAEGLGFESDRDIIIADTLEEYVAAIAALHSDRALWNRLSRNGQERAHRDHSFGNGISLMKQILSELGVRVATSADGS